MTTEPPYRVLVVDDEEALGQNVCSYLASQGWLPSHTTDLTVALERIENDLDLDLVITDIYLEGPTPSLGQAGGHVITKACEKRGPPIPVILMTGRPSLDAALGGLRSHAYDFLTKPVSLPLLEQRARKAVLEGKLMRRVRELQEVNRLLSKILPNAIEAKDPTTRGHSDRVVAYVDTLARKCRISASERYELRLAAQLHDVGKIGIPEAILTKPGKLTAGERAVIQEHPAIGFRILEPLHHFPRVRRWVYQHHERWDGHGYPEGLAGEEVDLPGRILILAEVFDALATARSYKQPWSNARIADFFESDDGHFDPELRLIVAEGVRTQGVRFFQPPQDPFAARERDQATLF